MIESISKGCQSDNLKLIDFGSCVFNCKKKQDSLKEKKDEDLLKVVKERKKYLTEGFYHP